jgi:hypothetical protein
VCEGEGADGGTERLRDEYRKGKNRLFSGLLPSPGSLFGRKPLRVWLFHIRYAMAIVQEIAWGQAKSSNATEVSDADRPIIGGL